MNALSPVIPGFSIPADEDTSLTGNQGVLREVIYGGGEYESIPAMKVPGPKGEVLLRYEMTTEEEELFRDGGCIYLSLLTFGDPLQPILLRVATPEMILAEQREIEFPEPNQDTSLQRIIPLEDTHPQSFNKSETLEASTQRISNCQVVFATYPDRTLQLFKPGSILTETPAGYSEQNVTIKALVRTPSEKFMVVLPTTRTFLDTPAALDILTGMAMNWRNRN